MEDFTTEQTPEQVEIAALRTHNGELLAELKAAKATAKQLSAHVETLTTERDQALTTLRAEALGRPVRAMVERVAVLPEHFEAEFERRGYQFVKTADGIAIHDADGKVPQLQDDERSAPRPCTFTAGDLGALVLERWKPEAERHPSAQAFAHLVIAPHATGGGATSSTAGAPTASPPARPAPAPQFGIR